MKYISTVLKFHCSEIALGINYFCVFQYKRWLGCAGNKTGHRL